MNRSLLVLGTALLASPVFTQTPRVTFTSDTPVGVWAKTQIHTKLSARPQGRNIYPGLYAIITGDSTTSRLQLGTRIRDGVEATLFWWGRGYRTRYGPSTTAGTTQSQDWRNIQPGPHSILVSLSGQARGTLHIYYGGRISGQGARASVAIDIDADNRVEYRWTAAGGNRSVTIPYNLSGTRRIRVTSDCLGVSTAPGPSGSEYQSSLAFNLKPYSGTAQSFGSGCGPKLTGRVFPNGLSHRVSLQVANAFSNSPLVWVFGTQKVNLQIPGTSCYVLTPAIAMVVGRCSGTYAWLTLNTPNYVVGSLLAQSYPFDLNKLRLAASNGVEIRFAR